MHLKKIYVAGVAKAPRSSFVTTYLDDNGEKAKTGWYLGKMDLLLFFPVFVVPKLFYVSMDMCDRVWVYPSACKRAGVCVSMYACMFVFLCDFVCVHMYMCVSVVSVCEEQREN